jgi:hypothetical protein
VEKYNVIYYGVNTLNIKGMILRLQIFQPKCYTYSSSISCMLHAPLYKVLSKIFQTGAAIYTAVVVPRSAGAW